jgi:fluoride exporter
VNAHLRDVLLVAAGGAVGSAVRYGVGKMMGPQADAVVPWHTFVVNATGAFALGLLIVLAARLGWPGWWRPLLAVGILGGYTTFSTFSLEVVEFALRGSWGMAGSYAALSLVAGFGGAAGGIFLGRAVA